MPDYFSSVRRGRTALLGGLLIWVFCVFLLIARSPAGAYTHDLRGHIEYTRILYNQRRLPRPREGWETSQPPLYYLVNTLLRPNDESHVFRVRLLSMLYGALALGLMSWILTSRGVGIAAQGMVLSFIATTPAFLFMFSTYNNDSLETLLAMGILVAVYSCLGRPGWRGLIVLGALVIAGLYTKLSLFFLLGAMTIVLGFLGLSGKTTWKKILPILGMFSIGGLFLMPWMVGGIYSHGQLTPAPADIPISQDIRLTATPLRTLLTPPGWTRGEWADPYVHLWENTRHKKNSYAAYLFASSIFGEYTFEFLPPIIPWAIIALHALLLIAALVCSRKSSEGVLALSVILFGALFSASLIFRTPYANLMDFRYITWTWLPGAVLCAIGLGSLPAAPRASRLTRLFGIGLICGTILHGALWLALIVGGRWTLP